MQTVEWNGNHYYWCDGWFGFSGERGRNGYPGNNTIAPMAIWAHLFEIAIVQGLHISRKMIQEEREKIARIVKPKSPQKSARFTKSISIF